MSDGALVKTADWIESNNVHVAQHVGPIALALLSIWIGIWAPDQIKLYSQLQSPSFWFWASQWTPWLLFVAIFINLYGGIVGSKTSRKKDGEIASLRDEINKLSPLSNQLEDAQLAIDQMRIDHADTIFSVTSDYLGHLSNDHLSLNDTERVSLYLHNGARFILAGRYSKNPELTKPSRTAFSETEGCIGKTWSHGGKYFVELPDGDTEYYDYLKNELRMDKGTAKNLRMKSKVYCSLAIEEGYKRIGIIMFESLNKGVLDQAAIEGLISEHDAYLKEMLRRTKTVNALVAYQNGGE